MELPRQYRAAVAASHCNICWFRNQYEANYLLVSRTLGFVVKTVLNKLIHEQPQAVRSKLQTRIPFLRTEIFLDMNRAWLLQRMSLPRKEELDTHLSLLFMSF